MEDVNDQTIKTYRDNFIKYAEKTPKEVNGEFKIWMDSFLSFVPKNGTIFEIGSATGRDASYFHLQRYKVFCTDVLPEELQKLSKKGFETAEFDFRDNPKQEWNNRFDGFFANAVLLHATQDVFKKTLINISSILKKRGVIAFSLKAGEGEEMLSIKMGSPRYFKYYTIEEIKEMLKELPYKIINISCADDGKWIHVIAQKTDS